jgi:hypothetical protein
MDFRDRIVELIRVPASELGRNSLNWRVHPKAQKDALSGVLADIGFVGALIARRLEDGSLELLDGHLRAEVSGDELVPVLVVDLDEDEANKVLATFDPLSAMAERDKSALRSLILSIRQDESLTDGGYLDALLGDMAEEIGGLDAPAEEPAESAVVSGDAPASRVRMVQLFLDEEGCARFMAMVDALQKNYETEGVTSTVLEVLRRQHRAMLAAA